VTFRVNQITFKIAGIVVEEQYKLTIAVMGVEYSGVKV